MHYLIIVTFLLSVCYINNAQEVALEQTAEINSFADFFPTLFRLKRSLIDNEDESIEPSQAKQFEQYIFQLILQTHGLNLGNLRDIYIKSDGDAQTTIGKLNEALGNEILYIDEEECLRINTDESLLFFNGYISRITKENPYVGGLVRDALQPYINRLRVNVGAFRVPIGAILERVKPHLSRSARSLNPYAGKEQFEVIRNVLHVISDWLKNATKSVLKNVIWQLNNVTFELFAPAINLLENFIYEIIDAIIITI